jgi:nucleoid DNA-binding protein
LIINKNPNNNKFNLAFYQDANPLDNFQGITEQDFILAKSLYQCSKNIDIRSNKTVVVVADKEGDTISSYSIPTRNDQSSHYNVSLIISKRPTTISIDPVNKAVKITNSSGQVINNPGISVLGGIYPINRDLNLSISLVNGLYSCAYVDSRNIKIDDQCLTSENSFPPKPSTCKMQSLGFVIGNDLVTDFNASGNAVYVKDFDAFLSAQDGKISLKKGGGEVLFSFNNSGLESNSLGGNLTTITENNYKLLDNQGNQLSLLFEKNNNQISLKLLKANGDGVQYNLTRDANLETYNIAGIVANQFITECSESQFINLPTTSTTSAQATTSTTSAQATTSTSSARETTAEVRQIQRTCNQTITDQHVQQNFYNDGNLFLSINASKNASVGKNTSISFAIGSSKIDFTFNPSQTIEQIASFFKKHFELKGYQVETELNPSNPNQTIISFQNLNPANTSLIITKNSGNITYQLAVNGTIINQCNLLTTNIVSQILEITSTSLNFTSSIPASTSSSVVVTTATSKTINDCDLRGNGVIQKTNGQDQFEVSKNRDSIEFKFLKSNKTLSFYNSTLRVDNSIQLFPYNFSDNNFNYTATNVFGNLKIIRNDGLEILINESGVVVSPDKDTKICNFENTKDKTTTIFDPTTNSITTSITSNGDTTTTSQNYTSAQVINATLLCLENDKFDNYSEFMSYLKDKNDQMPKNLVNISSSKFSSIVYNLKKALKDDNEIIKILNGINTSYCNRTDFIERIQKIDDILKAKKSQGSSRPNIAVPIAVPSALFVLAAFWAVTTKNPVQKLRNGFTVLTNFLSPNSATTTVARNDARGDFVYSEQLRPPAAEVSSSLSTTGINFGNPDLELGLPRRERGGLWGSVLRTLAGLYCLSNANGFQMAKESRDLYGNILQTKNLYSLSLTPAQLTLQGLDQRSLQEASPAFASNFASKGGFKFENEGFKFEFDQGSKNFILKDSLGNIKARCDETGEIIDSARTGRQRNPKLKLSKFGNMNLRYSHDDKAKKMTILDENKNGFQITFIGENILSSAVEEGRIISENFNGILIDHLLNEAKDFTFQDQKVLKTTILDHGIIIQKNPGNLMVFLFNEDRTGFNLDNFAEVINESNEHNDGFIFSPPNPDSPNKISFQIAGQDFYILVDQDTKQFSLYDSLDNKLESPSNKIIEDEQSLISITQDQVEFEITIDKDNVSIYSLINTLITPSNNYDFATRITMVSSNKLDFEEGYILNPQIINKFLDSICKLSGNDQVIASYVKSIKSILDDRSLSDKGNILTIFKNIDDYLQFNNFVLVGLFESTQEIFIKKNQAEIQAKSEAELQAMIISQDQSKSLQEVISQSMQSTFDQHISREVDISQEAEEYLASLPKVAQQSVLDKQEYVSVARSRIRGIKKENKFGMLNSNQSNNHEYYDDSEYGSYIEDYDDDYSLVDESLQKDYDLIDDDRSDISTAEFEEPAEDDDQVAKYGSYRDALLKEDKNPLITSSISKEREQQLAELERKIPDLISKIERLDLLRKQQLKYVHGRPENGVKAINRREESYKSYFKSLKINRAQDKLLSQFNLIVESILRENPNSKSAIEASKYIDIIRADKDIDNKHPFFDNASLTQRNKIKEIVDKKLSQYKILQRESKIQERKWGKLSVSALKAKSGDQPKEPNTLEVSKAKGKALSPSNEKGSISDR